MESLKDKTARGLLWGGMGNGVQQAVGLAFGIILGRLLTDADYGMIAIISVYSLVATALQNSGFATALTNLKDDRDEDYNSVFWFNITVGTACYVILFLAAPLLAVFYHQPAVVPLARYAFLSIIIASWGTAQQAWLFKHLRAKQQAKAAMIAVIVSSSVGAGMAWMGCRYWSLATQGLVYVSLTTLLAWHYSPWRPTLHIDLRPALHMFRFSSKILATTITTHINNNVLNILLGHYYTGHDAGRYNQAYQWNTKCYSLVGGMVQQVAQPVLATLNDAPGRQLNVLRKLMRFTAFISFPLLLGLALVAHEFIVLAITEKWLGSVPLLQTLCVAGAVMPLTQLLSNAIISRGLSTRYFLTTFTLGVLQILIMIFIWRQGVQTMVWAYTALNVVWLFVWWAQVSRLTGYRLTMLLADIMPFALSAVAVMAVTGYVTSLLTQSLWLLLLSRVVMAAVLYYLVMRIAGAQILREAQAFVLGKHHRD